MSFPTIVLVFTSSFISKTFAGRTNFCTAYQFRGSHLKGYHLRKRILVLGGLAGAVTELAAIVVSIFGAVVAAIGGLIAEQ